MEATSQEMLECIAKKYEVSLTSERGIWTISLTDEDDALFYRGQNAHLFTAIAEAHDA